MEGLSMIEKSRRVPGLKPLSRDKKRLNAGIPSLTNAFADRKKAALSSVAFIRFEGQNARALLPKGIDTSISFPIQLSGPTIKLDPAQITSESLLTGMIRVLAWDPNHENAEIYRASIMAIHPELFEELIAAGIQKAEEKNWMIAEEIFFAASGINPERPEPFINLALMHEEHAKQSLNLGDEEESEREDEIAHKYYQYLLNLDHVFAPAYYHAAFFFLRKHNYEKTVELLTSYIDTSDDENRIQKAKSILEKLNNMGYLDTLFKEAYDFIQMGEEAKGFERAARFVEKYPEIWNGWFLVGWANRRLGRWTEAARAFLTALDKGAEGADIYNELSLCEMELGDFEKARLYLERALRMEPENVKIIVNLGALAYRQGKMKEAEGFFNTAIEFEPEDKIAKEWLKKIANELSGSL